jgi:biopolymer transport protein ExbB/TolQ
MLELMQKGGLVMWPILGCALVAIAIIVERALYFIITGTRYELFRDMLVRKLDSGGFDNATLLDNPFRGKNAVRSDR